MNDDEWEEYCVIWKERWVDDHWETDDDFVVECRNDQA